MEEKKAKEAIINFFKTYEKSSYSQKFKSQFTAKMCRDNTATAEAWLILNEFCQKNNIRYDWRIQKSLQRIDFIFSQEISAFAKDAIFAMMSNIEETINNQLINEIVICNKEELNYFQKKLKKIGIPQAISEVSMPESSIDEQKLQIIMHKKQLINQACHVTVCEMPNPRFADLSIFDVLCLNINFNFISLDEFG